MQSQVLESRSAVGAVELSSARTSAAAIAEQCWFAPAWTMFPLARRRCLVRNRDNGASIELDSGEYAVLSTCESCRTLNEHEAHAEQRLSASPAHRPAIRELLERCARGGLLISLPDLVARFGTATATRRESIAGISIPTADRPQLLRRLVSGADALQGRTGMAYRWHVFDDSRSAENRRANRGAIASCPDLEVTYHDLSASDSLENRLATELPELSEEVRLLLAAAQPGEMTYGRTRNYLLLRFAGQRFLSIDDDALVDPRRPPLARAGVDVGAVPKAAYWYDSFDAATAACPELPLDPFAEHARWLGLSMAEAWRLAEREPGELRIRNLPGAAAAHFDPDARVLFTWNHVLGDPGLAKFSGELLAVNSDTRAWLAANPGAARTAFETQLQWRGYPSLQLSPQQSLSTTTLAGFDNTVLLPPAARTGAESDTLIGELTRCAHPSAWVASLPFALPHLRDASRQWLSATEPPGPAYANRVFIDYARARSSSIRAGDPAARLVALGAMLLDFASSSDTTLYSVVEEQAADMASRLAFQINEQLDDSATPVAWKEMLRPWLASPLLQIDPASLRRRRPPLGPLRTRAREIGKTLIAWPRLWAWCRENAQAWEPTQ